MQTALEKADADNKAAIDAQITALKAELTQADADNKKAIEERLEKLNTDLSALIKANADNIAALQTTAADLQEQIDTVNTDIANIKTELEGKITDSEKKVLNELNTLKTSIEGQIATINADITALKAKDTELDGKITDLKTYVDTQDAETVNWANATFATLEQYAAVQNTISGIKTDIANINADITAIENDVAAKVETINKSIADLDAELAAKVTEVTTGYTNAIAAAKSEIETAYTKAIADAITASETSMKAWVTETLTDGYYTIAEIDAKIKALEATDSTLSTELSAQISALETALATAKAELTTAYTAAITEAINDNNGIIDTKIETAIATAKSELNASITAIELRVAALELKVTENSEKIAELEKEITELKIKINCLSGIHEANEDDGDCTTAVLCKHCNAVTTEAKTHDFTGECQSTEDGHYHICQNDGCIAESEVEAHTLTYTNNDNGTHTESCEHCGYSATIAHSLKYVPVYGEYDISSTHTASCQYCDYSVTAEHTDGYVDYGDGTHGKACQYCHYFNAGMGYVEPEAHTVENCICIYCSAVEHTAMDSATGICSDCGSFVATASVTVDGTATYCYTLDEVIALADGKGNAVIVIQKDCRLRELWYLSFASGNITLDLNGKKVSTNSNFFARLADCDDLTLTIKDSVGGGQVVGNISVNRGKLIIEGGIYVSAYDNLIGEVICSSGGTLFISGGELGRVAVSTGGVAEISGGSFENVDIYSSAGTLDSLLADNYCFYDADGNAVDTSSVEAENSWYKLYNVTVDEISE